MRDAVLFLLKKEMERQQVLRNQCGMTGNQEGVDKCQEEIDKILSLRANLPVKKVAQTE